MVFVVNNTPVILSLMTLDQLLLLDLGTKTSHLSTSLTILTASFRLEKSWIFTVQSLSQSAKQTKSKSRWLFPSEHPNSRNPSSTKLTSISLNQLFFKEKSLKLKHQSSSLTVSTTCIMTSTLIFVVCCIRTSSLLWAQLLFVLKS